MPALEEIAQARRICVRGIVQGVGFRPFVYRLAKSSGLAGCVYNCEEGVVIEVEGGREAIDLFMHRLTEEAPPLSRIVSVAEEPVPLRHTDAFHIAESRRTDQATTMVAPDVATCDDCLRELFDPKDRRFGYPFINCTNCGPRYTIVEQIPYDRPYTSMRVFTMCPDCAREYEDPLDRRFHAQPNACAVCGPSVWLADPDGHELDRAEPIERAVALLQAGYIVAVRGMGGFHLAVDGRNELAIRDLRLRKGRAERPFALMAPDVETLRRYARVSPDEEALLLQPARPIVLLDAIAGNELAPSVAPGQRALGFMLPYTPLHHLLLRKLDDVLVMTSGNLTDEPIAISNDEALERLGELADAFLFHDREILQRCDDSIMRMAAGQPRFIRRSRGFAPAPVLIKRPTGAQLLACGGELKNTIAFARGHAVHFSQHIGDLDNPLALAFFKNSIAHLSRLLDINLEVIAHDLHPEYLSTKWAVEQHDVPRIGVQHHHAHLAAVLAEHGVAGPAIGVILDGTGYGADGTIWGGEVLVGDAGSYNRFAWLKPFALPGGAAAIRQPWRTAMSLLYSVYGDQVLDLDLPAVRSTNPRDASRLFQMIDQGINAPLTSSCGRLFDGFSALLGLCTSVTYEAQAAMALEAAVDDEAADYAPGWPSEGGALSWAPLLQAVVEDLQRGIPSPTIASRFHGAVAGIFLAAARAARAASGVNVVALSGGVFQNVVLLNAMSRQLEEAGFHVLSHSRIPTNDGGLALGQVAVADAWLAAQGGSASFTST